MVKPARAASKISLVLADVHGTLGTADKVLTSRAGAAVKALQATGIDIAIVSGGGIAAPIDKTRRSGGHGVIACSALKSRYRDILISHRVDVRLVYLKGDETLIARRISTRHEHFMPRSLLHSQFDTLEEPGADENPIIVSIEPAPREIVARILSAVNMVDDAPPLEQTSLRPSGPGA